MQTKTETDWYLPAALIQPPQAVAVMRGSAAHPRIWGFVRFYALPFGTLVCAEITGLPQDSGCAFFGFHIHENGDCGGQDATPFADAGAHYNPKNRPHPCHAGDLPPLLIVGGYALSVFLTDRFTVEEVRDRAVMIHGKPDDFTTQPAGNAGDRIACGIIRAR